MARLFDGSRVSAQCALRLAVQTRFMRLSARVQDRIVPAGPVLDLVVPVYNEARVLDESVRRLRHFLDAQFPLPTRITIVDNASTDGTRLVAERLARDVDGVVAVHLDAKGRGRALRAAWSRSDAEVVAYTDVDLSTDLAALPPMLTAILSGHSDIAVGSRLHRSSRVTRGLRREFISRGYNLLLRTAVAARFSDAQCGFKAVRADVARALLPLIEDENWFFDTELLVLAQRGGLRILDVPVDWVDDPDSRVDVLATALGDLRGVWRLGRAMASGSLNRRLADEIGNRERRFGHRRRRVGVGIASALMCVALLVVLRGEFGFAWAVLGSLPAFVLGATLFRFPVLPGGLVRRPARPAGSTVGSTNGPRTPAIPRSTSSGVANHS